MNQTDWKAISTVYAKAVEKSWTDPQFRSQLVADPRSALTAEGASIPPDITIKVVENSDAVVHLVLPPPPSGELSEDALAAATGGAACGAGTCAGCKGKINMLSSMHSNTLHSLSLQSLTLHSISLGGIALRR